MEDDAPIHPSAAEISPISSPATDHIATESMSTGWTDEKHSTFLSSMEASFVDELYTNHYSKDLPSWLSRWINRMQPTGFAKEEVPSHQSKVLPRQSLNNQNLVSETAKNHVDTKIDSSPLGSNPWIRRLRSIATGKEAQCKVSDTINGVSHSSPSQERSQRFNEATNPAYLVCPQDSATCSREEVSDQNFICDELETREGRVCKKRMLKSKSPINNQVVPSTSSQMASNSRENDSNLDKGNAGSSHR